MPEQRARDLYIYIYIYIFKCQHKKATFDHVINVKNFKENVKLRWDNT